jgi:hypothetical protein
MNPEPLFIGLSRAAPPAGGVVRLLAPSQEVSTRELPSIPGPKVILGGPPCDHWSEVMRDRADTLYVLVEQGDVPPFARGGATSLPAAPIAQLRRYFSRLLELKKRYPGGLPEIDESSFAWKGCRVGLTPTESALLQRLYEYEGAIVGREELARIAGVVSTGSRALDAHVHRLRQKLHVPGVELLTERQRGFRLVLS